MHLRLDETRFDLFLFVDKEVWNSQRVQKRLHHFSMVVSPPVHLAELPAVAHDHYERHVVTIGKPHDRLAALPQARILHDHDGFLTAEVGTDNDAGKLCFVRSWNVADPGIGLAEAVDARELRIRNGG